MLYRRLTASLLTTGLLSGAWPLAAAAQRAKAPSRPEPTVSLNIPVNVSAPFPKAEDNLPYFDDFSWREFIALTWPVRVGTSAPFPRGVPDSKKKYGDVSVPGVWETWKADYELFLPDGSAPADWQSFATPSPCDGDGTLVPYQKVLGSFARYHGFNQASMTESGGPLVSQNGQYVRYETRVNQAEYKYITNPGGSHPGPLYLVKNLPGNGSANPPLKFPSGSVEVKASWRVMTGVPDKQRKRYYITQAKVLDPVSGTCTLADVGLIGLHIVNKTPTLPQWVWSTFEHVDNVPALPGESSQAAPPYSLNDNDPKTPLSEMGKPISQCNPPQQHPAPTQVVRKRPIAASTQQTNKAYQQAKGVKGTVWENYQLVLTQWPVGATDTFPSTAQPQPQTNTANVATETWVQDSTATSCMGCHSVSNNHQYDFVWFLPLGAYPRHSEPCQPQVASATPAAQPSDSLAAPLPAAPLPAVERRNKAVIDLRDLMNRTKQGQAAAEP
ncbi:hypothetical protein ACN28I_41795 [Archangium gephyra]|uniref:hypothetical protein n=1 Tax=Archangium gephyra TaxID=48 RepID=UPI003B7CE9C0